jgi:triacylglycerol lipase
MDTRHLVDPELLAGLEYMPGFDLSDEALPAIRQGMEETVASQPVPEGLEVDVEERTISGGDSQPMRLFIYRPRSGARGGAILQIHGGGYVMGSASMSDIPSRLLAVSLGCVVVSVDYRLAPETPHPGPVEDCYAALKWLAGEAAALGVDPARIAIKGESAGGGLAAGLALLARDRGGPAVCHQHLIYPMIDDRTGTVDDPHPHCGAFVCTRESNRYGWRSLLGREPGGEGVAPYAAAARAEKLDGLPPAFISTGSLDLFLEENLEYAKRLLRAGVATELHVWPGAYHGFEINADARVTRASGEASFAALGRALA